MKNEDLEPDGIKLLEPLVFEQEVAANLSLRIDSSDTVMFNTEPLPGTTPGSRSMMFSEPGIYTLQGHSSFPLRALSNVVTIKVG